MRNLLNGYSVTLFLSCLVVTVILLFLVPPITSPFVRALLNSGHTLLFAVFTLLLFPIFLNVFKRFFTTWNDKFVGGLAFAAAIFCFGAAVEFLQSKIGRTASWGDVTLNMVGVGAGFCVLSFIKSDKKFLKFLYIGGVIATCVVAFREPFIWAKSLYLRNQQFPILVNFARPDTSWFAKKSSGSAVTLVEQPLENYGFTDNFLKVSFTQGLAWPGWVLAYPYPDWRGYSALSFEVISPLAYPVELSFRVNDRSHKNEYSDRFNGMFTVHPGRNTFTIPLADIRDAPQSRQMNMAEIAQLVWFSGQPEKEFVLYFGSVYLK